MKFTIYGSGGWFFKTEKRSFREIGEKYRSRTTLKKFIWKPWSTQSSHRQYSSESNSGRHNASGLSSRVLSQTFSLFSIFCMISSFFDMSQVSWTLNAGLMLFVSLQGVFFETSSFCYPRTLFRHGLFERTEKYAYPQNILRSSNCARIRNYISILHNVEILILNLTRSHWFWHHMIAANAGLH